jgi:hypothetical protein
MGCRCCAMVHVQASGVQLSAAASCMLICWCDALAHLVILFPPIVFLVLCCLLHGSQLLPCYALLRLVCSKLLCVQAELRHGPC